MVQGRTVYRVSLRRKKYLVTLERPLRVDRASIARQMVQAKNLADLLKTFDQVEDRYGIACGLVTGTSPLYREMLRRHAA